MSSLQDSTVFIVEGSSAGRKELTHLLGPLGVATQAFASAEDFLEAYEPEWAGCLLLELDLPGMSGADLQARLAADEIALPVVFVAAEADVATVVPLMKAGAVEFLSRPCEETALCEGVRHALLLDDRRRRQHALRRDVRARVATLTEGERRVMEMLIDGQPNKCIAVALEISRRTVDSRRATIMKKMQARSPVELAQLLTLVRTIEEWNDRRLAESRGATSGLAQQSSLAAS